MGICAMRDWIYILLFAVLLGNCGDDRKEPSESSKYSLILHNVNNQVLGEKFNVWVEVRKLGVLRNEGYGSKVEVFVEWNCGNSEYRSFGKAFAVDGVAKFRASVNAATGENCKLKASTTVHSEEVSVVGRGFTVFANRLGRVGNTGEVGEISDFTGFNLAVYHINTQVTGVPFKVQVDIRNMSNKFIRGDKANSSVFVEYRCFTDGREMSDKFAEAKNAEGGSVIFTGSIGTKNLNSRNDRHTNCMLTATATMGEQELIAESNVFTVESFTPVRLTFNPTSMSSAYQHIVATVQPSMDYSSTSMPETTKYRWWYQCFDHQLHSKSNSRIDLPDNEVVNTVPLERLQNNECDEFTNTTTCKANFGGHVDYVSGMQSGRTRPYYNKRSYFTKKCVIKVEADIDGSLATMDDRTTAAGVFVITNPPN